MSRLFKLFFFINFTCILIECLIRGPKQKLSVRKLDKKFIERKRQDTVDMCRIFTEETQKLEKLKKIKNYGKMPSKIKHRRVKRSLQDINPALNEEDAQRVETIVDKMYDDLLEQGEKVKYRRAEVSMAKSNKPSNKSGRRYFFAPSVLEGLTTTVPLPEHNDKPLADSNTPRFKHGIIPYFIDSASYDAELVEVITNAFDYFEKATCIRLQRLRERPTDAESLKKVEWLYITNPTGIKQCVHSNEQAHHEGVQMIVFGYNCMALGDISHELMHVLGFPHEHVRPDRDQYITILWDNIKPGYKKYFEMNTAAVADNIPYDYASVLHYPPRAFTRNGQATIITQPGIKIGQREGLSEIDIEKINSLYSAECVKRNREYLLQTCPSVVKTTKPLYVNITMKDIEDYYGDIIWPYGIVNYKISDKTQFSEEEIENINAVIRHIEKETCIEFRNIGNDPIDIETEESELDVDSKNVQEYKTGDEIEDSEDDINQVATKHKMVDSSSDSRSVEYKAGFDFKDVITEKEAPGQSENEIKTDEAHHKGFKRSGINSEFETEKHASEELSLRAAKKNIRQKKSVQNPVNKTQAIKTTNLKSNMKNKNRTVPISPSRRHATNVVSFTRHPISTCNCPTPGVPYSADDLEINAGCFNSVNDLLHLFVHILGLDHQHNSHDRDSYLHILWDQLTDDVKKDMEEILPPVASLGFPYDYQSVMHFPWLQIKDGRTNIMYPIWNDGWAMGHWQGLSSTDVLKLNLLYEKQCNIRRKAVEEANTKTKKKLKNIKRS